MEQHVDNNARLKRYLSPLAAWAMSFGCAVGWGAFVMPGTTFLPVAGPLGTLIGLAVGAAAMFLIGRNYHYLIQHFPEAGGAYGYVKRVCGHDHGYICGWFLILTYIAIAWANATALALIGRKLLGGMFSFGFRYHIAGYDVYAGEIMLSAMAVLVIGGVFLAGKRVAARLQTVLALVLLGGIAICFVAAAAKHEGGIAAFAPAFSDGGGTALQIFGIIALAPWAFVGFESVSHSAEEFAFPRWLTVGIIVSSLIAAAAAYMALTFVAASTLPPGFSSWREYMANLGSFNGIEALPAFYAVKRAMGHAGLVILCFTTLAAIVTGLVGHTVAASRLLYAMAHDGLLPEPLSRLDADNSPRNAILLILALSLVVPFFGRTAIGWIVDVTTIGASIAYGYVSYCTFRVARDEGRRFVMVSGMTGLVVSVSFMVYYLVPNFWVVDALATESYFILAIWSIIGVLVFRGIFSRDTTGRLGTSTVAWLALLFFVFFSGHMWNRQMTRDLTSFVVTEIHAHLDEVDNQAEHDDGCDFLERQKDRIDYTLTYYNMIQIGLVVIALAIMYSIYSIISKRERQAAKAKAYFFSTISHDVRTPLNAIVGFSQMLKLGFKTKKESDDALDSILASSKALLGLINDILDLSRCDVGKAEVAHTPTDCHALMHEIVEAFHAVNTNPKLEIRDNIAEMPVMLLDHMRLRHVIFNLMANAVKFTEKGFIELRAKFDVLENGAPTGTLRIEVEDTGVGISAEDQKHIDSPYEQTGSTKSRNGGTGFGLAVGRQFVEAMGGKLTVKSATGKGSTFYIDIPGVHVAPKEAAHEIAAPVHTVEAQQAAKPRLLLVDDSKMNLSVLKALIKRLGNFEMETAMDGREALERLKRTDLPEFDVVLTDMWMPEMDGEGLAKAIREDDRLAKLPVYVITADVELSDTYGDKGFDDILLKPVTMDGLRSLLPAFVLEGGGGGEI